jgi:hypothetical protein
MKTYGGSGSKDPRLLNLATSWRCAISFTLRRFYSRGKSPRYPLDSMMGGPQESSLLYRGSNSDPSVIQNVNLAHVTNIRN